MQEILWINYMAKVIKSKLETKMRKAQFKSKVNVNILEPMLTSDLNAADSISNSNYVLYKCWLSTIAYWAHRSDIDKGENASTTHLVSTIS